MFLFLTALGYHKDPQTRAAFMEVLTKILQQGTEFETLAETALADRFERLVELVTMIGDKGELPIAMALATVVPTQQMVSIKKLYPRLTIREHNFKTWWGQWKSVRLGINESLVWNSPEALCCIFEQVTLFFAWYWFNPGRQKIIQTWLKNVYCEKQSN